MSNTTYNVLSLDGGGLRGVITSVLLTRIEAVMPTFLENVDLIVGTSTGGILALALAKGWSPARITSMYVVDGPKIFHRSPWRRLGSLFGATKAKYDNDGLTSVLRGVFGDTRLNDLRKKVAITAFSLEHQSMMGSNWSPKIFHNYMGEDSDGIERALDVAMYTSAAPSFFPSVNNYVDGGVFANNPSLVGLAQALDDRHIAVNSKPRRLENIRLLSVGTGVDRFFIAGDRHDWGVAEWASPLLNILLDGVSEIADFQCQQLLQGNYHRLQVTFPKGVSISMDDVSKIDTMISLGSCQNIQQTLSWLLTSNW